MNESIAGPSSRPYFPPTLRLDNEAYQPSNSSRASSPEDPPLFPETHISRPASRAPSRAPSRPPSRANSRAGSRARSASVFSGYNVDGRRYDEKIRKKRYESVQRLKSAWELLLEKYGTVQVEDDDEIDLMTGEVVKNRGKLQNLEAREFGQISDEEFESEEDEVGTTFDSDEDELGAWDERSGLDNQEPGEDEEPPPVVPVRWTMEDQVDLDIFLRLEQERRDKIKENGEEIDWSDEDEADDDDDVPLRLPQRSRSMTRRASEEIPTLGTLDAGDSDDELLAQTSDAEEATRIDFIPSDEDVDGEPSRGRSRRRSEPAGPAESNRTKDLRRQTLPPQPPPASSLLASSLPRPQHQSLTENAIAGSSRLSPQADVEVQQSLRDLFTPPVDTPPPERLPIVASVPQRTAFYFGESVFAAVRAESKEQRERERAAQRTASGAFEQPEQPGGPLDPAFYFTSVMRSRNGVTLRLCRACVEAGGERQERAAWCRGRQCARWCGFGNSVVAPGSPARDVSQPRARASRHCQRCRRVGGQRGEVAMHCKGRRRRELCPYDSDDTDAQVFVQVQQKKEIVPTAPLPDVNVAKLDTRRYHSDVHYTHGGARVRQCLMCKLKGGVREKRAAWCKGRWRIDECTFKQSDPAPEFSSESDGDQADDEDLQPAVRDSSDFTRHRSTTRRLASPLPAASATPDPVPMESSLLRASRPASPPPLPPFNSSTRPPPHLDSERYLPELSFISLEKGQIRMCPKCRKAGGQRAESAPWCRGRGWSKQCSFRDHDGDAEWTRALMTSRSRSVTPVKKAPTGAPLGPPLGDGYYLDVRHSPGKTTFVRCEACARGGEARESKAIWCKGRKHARLCGWYEADLAAEVEAAERVERVGREGGQENRLPFDEAPAAAPTTLPLFLSTNSDDEDAGLADHRRSNGKRKRGSSSASPSRDRTHSRGESAEIRIDPFDIGFEGPNDQRIEDASPDIRGVEDRASRSASFSLPPSSPPGPVEPVESPSFRIVSSRPTPSPTVSLTRTSRSPARPFAAPQHVRSSPMRNNATFARAATFAFRPTPPSSISARSASILSDQGSLTHPRRGILRRPSDFDRPGSVPRHSKRTRFSLAPLSPPRQIHSDPIRPALVLDIDPDEDELLLGPSTSPAYHPSIQDRAAAALEYSREISIRARDVGFNLSAHTGRLSSGMLAALAPALDRQRPATLGSSLRHSITSESTQVETDRTASTKQGYSLPTPPPSHIAVPGRPARARSTSSSTITVERPDPSGHTVKCMPPPPVPAAARLPTPQSAEDEPESDHELVTPINRKIKRARSRSCSRSTSRSRSRPRSMPRTRSMSAMLDKTSRRDSEPSPARGPASTPRRRSDRETILEVIARSVDDESLEWGMDEDVGEELGKMWREGSVVRYLE